MNLKLLYVFISTIIGEIIFVLGVILLNLFFPQKPCNLLYGPTCDFSTGTIILGFMLIFFVIFMTAAIHMLKITLTAKLGVITVLLIFAFASLLGLTSQIIPAIFPLQGVEDIMKVLSGIFIFLSFMLIPTSVTLATYFTSEHPKQKLFPNST